MADERRVALIANTSFFVGPPLARLLAGRHHDLVIGDPEEGLVADLEARGATVEVVTGVGRGGEEMVYLRRAGVPVEVVPGITAAAGCGASAGIPLTHRDYVSAVTFVTGHATSGEPDLDWAALATGRHTLVVYMGVSTAGTVARRLIEHGMDPATPAAIVENGTRADEVVVMGTVADLERMVAANRIVGPAVIIVGDVVRLAGEEALPALARAAAV